MLAVMKTGGKQYKVKEGDFISVEKLSLDLGAKLEISDVLMIEKDGSTKLISIKNQDTLSKLLDMAPGLVNRFIKREDAQTKQEENN